MNRPIPRGANSFDFFTMSQINQYYWEIRYVPWLLRSKLKIKHIPTSTANVKAHVLRYEANLRWVIGGISALENYPGSNILWFPIILSDISELLLSPLKASIAPNGTDAVIFISILAPRSCPKAKRVNGAPCGFNVFGYYERTWQAETNLKEPMIPSHLFWD